MPNCRCPRPARHWWRCDGLEGIAAAPQATACVVVCSCYGDGTGAQSMITYEQLLADQAKHRAAFGRMLWRWRIPNNWPIHGPAQLAELRGFRPVPYGLWHQMEAGAAGELQSVTFMALGELNQHAPVPLGDWDGETTRWGPTEFWACYCGLRPVPDWWRES